MFVKKAKGSKVPNIVSIIYFFVTVYLSVDIFMLSKSIGFFANQITTNLSN